MKVKKLSFGLALALALSVPSTAFAIPSQWSLDSAVPFAAMPSGTVVIGYYGYDLSFANGAADKDDIRDELVKSGGKVYVKDFSGKFVDNKTGLPVDMNTLIKYPEIVYRKSEMDAVCYPNTSANVLMSYDIGWKKVSAYKGQSLVNVESIKLTAGIAANNVKVTGLKIECSKMTKDRHKYPAGSADSIIKDISIWDGSNRISPLTEVKGGIADITFMSPIAINAGQSKDLYIKVDVSNTADAGSDILFETGDKDEIKMTPNVYYSPSEFSHSSAVGEMIVTK